MGRKQKLKSSEVQSLQKFKNPSEIVAINTVRITEVQLKTWLAMLYYARDSFKAETHLVSLKELNELSGYAQHDKQYLKEAMLAFCETAIRFNTLEKSKQDYGGVITCLLAGADFDKHPGFVEFAFSPMLKRVIENSNMFSNLSLALIRNLETKAAVALYRVLNDYRGVRLTPEIPLEKLREILGIDDGEYPEFKDFNKWILKPACKQLKEKTDLETIPHFFRGAHGKVHAVKFEIKEQKMPLLVKPKPLSDQKKDKKKREVSMNPYGHLTHIEAQAAFNRIVEQEELTKSFTADNQNKKALLKEHIKTLGGAT
jgi:plasmid replication initiation protein